MFIAILALLLIIAAAATPFTSLAAVKKTTPVGCHGDDDSTFYITISPFSATSSMVTISAGLDSNLWNGVTDINIDWSTFGIKWAGDVTAETLVGYEDDDNKTTWSIHTQRLTSSNRIQGLLKFVEKPIPDIVPNKWVTISGPVKFLDDVIGLDETSFFAAGDKVEKISEYEQSQQIDLPFSNYNLTTSFQPIPRRHETDPQLYSIDFTVTQPLITPGNYVFLLDQTLVGQVISTNGSANPTCYLNGSAIKTMIDYGQLIIMDYRKIVPGVNARINCEPTTVAWQYNVGFSGSHHFYVRTKDSGDNVRITSSYQPYRP